MQSRRGEREADERRKRDGMSASLHVQGDVAEFKIHTHRASAPPGRRGEITEFSRGARLRMLKALMRIDFANTESPLFVTLTYPDECATPDLDRRNVHRKVFARKLEQLMGRHVPASWRIEWVQRKSGEHIGKPCPHWHLLIFRVGFIPYADINRIWKETIGHEGYVRTDIQRVDKRGSIQGYMAKYISKDACASSLVIAAYQNKLGRSYGWLRQKEIPWSYEHYKRSLSGKQMEQLTEWASQITPFARAGALHSFTLIGDSAGDAIKIADGVPLTEG